MQEENAYTGDESLLPIELVKGDYLPKDIFTTTNIEALLGIAEKRIETLKNLSSMINQGDLENASALIDQLINSESKAS